MLRAAMWPALLSIVLFAPCLGGGFCYDDEAMLVDNPHIVKATLWSIVSTDYWGMKDRSWTYIHYRPLAVFSFAAIQRVFGLSPFAYHGAGILMNAIATVSFYALLLGLKQRPPVALAATFLFAVHPLHVEPVAWMVGLTETQSAALTMMSLACFVHGKRGWSILLAALAIFTKESAMIIPVLIVALDWMAEDSAAGPTPDAADHAAPGANRVATDVARRLRTAIPYAAIAVAYLAARWFILPHPPQGAFGRALAAGWRVIPPVTAHYVKAIFWPWPLAVHYELPGTALTVAVLLAVAAWTAAMFALPALRGDFALSNTLIALTLAIPILTAPLHLRPLYVGDRMGYLPTAGACLMIAVLLSKLPGRALLFGCMLLVPIGAMCTYLQVDVWENNEALWRHTLLVTPTSESASENLAYELYMDKRFNDAEKVLREGLRYHPADKSLLNDLANLHHRGIAAPSGSQ